MVSNDTRGRSDGWFNWCHLPVEGPFSTCDKPVWVSALRRKQFEADLATYGPTDVPHVCRQPKVYA